MAKNLPLLCVLLLSVLSLNSIVEARIRHYRWEIKYEFKSQDCFRKLVITINGRTPGPSIRAQQGDIIIVDLKNSLLTENVAIHWHGIRQVHKHMHTGWFESIWLVFEDVRNWFVYDLPIHRLELHGLMERKALLNALFYQETPLDICLLLTG